MNNIPSVPALAKGWATEAVLGAVALSWAAARRPSTRDWPGSTFLWGPVGVGKTTAGHLLPRVLALVGDEDPFGDVVRAVIRGDGSRLIEEAMALPAGRAWPLIRLQVQTMEPVDVRGIPHVVHTPEGAWAIFPPPGDFYPLALHERGVILVDDFPQGEPAVMRALASILGEGRVPAQAEPGRPLAVPPGWRILATGNFPDENDGAFPVGDFLRNRMVHLHLRSEAYYPQAWARPSSSPDRAQYVRGEARRWLRAFGYHPMVVAFLESHPEWVEAGAEARELLGFPTQRSWAMVSGIAWAEEEIAARGEARERLEVLLSLTVYGAVGAEAGQAFLAFRQAIREAHLPTPLEILERGEAAPLPAARGGKALEASGAIYYALRAAEAAIMASLHEARSGNLASLGRAMAYLARLGDRLARDGGAIDLLAAVLAALVRTEGFALLARQASPEAWSRLAANEALRRVLGL